MQEHSIGRALDKATQASGARPHLSHLTPKYREIYDHLCKTFISLSYTDDTVKEVRSYFGGHVIFSAPGAAVTLDEYKQYAREHPGAPTLSSRTQSIELVLMVPFAEANEVSVDHLLQVCLARDETGLKPSFVRRPCVLPSIAATYTFWVVARDLQHGRLLAQREHG